MLSAIESLVKANEFDMPSKNNSHNRMNSMGEALEKYVADMFADSFGLAESDRMFRWESVFSYKGNQNNPPDLIIRNGDAIEVKKVEKTRNTLALNSSHPKDRLYIEDSRISSACKSCEKWTVKDIIYAVGTVNNNKISNLCMVYGTEYAAMPEVYERIANTIKNGITRIESLEFNETNELGRVNRVDPLGITSLRIRGMWSIVNPVEVFDYIYEPDPSYSFNLMALINERKYNTIDSNTRRAFENLVANSTNLEMKSVKVRDPNNPVNLVDSRIITYVVR